MFIKELHLSNVKLLNNVRIPFTRDGKPRPWTVLVGENGLCKTTILQAIALAAGGPDRANQLLTDARSLADRRNPGGSSTIGALFGFGAARKGREFPGLDPSYKGTPDLFSTLTIFDGFRIFLGNSQYLNSTTGDSVSYNSGNGKKELTYPLQVARARGLSHWFVAGYGVTRSLPPPMEVENLADPVLDRLAPLFDRRRLIGTGFLELFENAALSESYADVLLRALIEERRLLPRIQSVSLGRWDEAKKAKSLADAHLFRFQAGEDLVSIPATWLSHGYQSMISWVADLVGQIFWDAGEAVPLDEMEGLVLIDELDIHLHPTWQLGLIQALKAVFPRLQFVATTHSPMLLPGLEADEIFHVFQDDEGNVQVKKADQSPSLMTGSEIYNTFFGIDRLYPTDVGADLQRYGYLSSDPGRTDDEDRELAAILVRLQGAGVDPGWEPTPRKKKVAGRGKRT
ncbi:AAA family ATPase [Singulisphaera rosea]